MREASQRHLGTKRTGNRALPAFLWAFAAFLAISSPLTCRLGAQAIPVLHRRADSEAVETTDSITLSRGRTTLPLDASGAYSLGESGESIEIDLQPSRLDGYISRLGKNPSDAGTPLTFFFANSVLNGRQLSFATRCVHGIWFSFSGTIVRGAAQSRAQDGYYRLEGKLVLHDAAGSMQEEREVSLPLERQYSNG